MKISILIMVPCLSHITLNKYAHQGKAVIPRVARFISRTIWLHLVDKVSFHLSKIISVVDRNSGLDHVRAVESWKRELFVKMVNFVNLGSTADNQPLIK